MDVDKKKDPVDCVEASDINTQESINSLLCILVTKKGKNRIPGLIRADFAHVQADAVRALMRRSQDLDEGKERRKQGNNESRNHHKLKGSAKQFGLPQFAHLFFDGLVVVVGPRA